jgi:flagellar biosynthesis protein FliR
MALTAMLRQIPEQFRAMVALLATFAGVARDEWGEPYSNKIPGDGRLARAAQAGTVISVVVIGVIALIGILIFAQINDALPAIDNTQLDNSATSVTDGFANAMELVPIVLLVLVAALVIGVVQRMRGRGM